MNNLFKHYFGQICNCPERDRYFKEMEYIYGVYFNETERFLRNLPHRKHWFSDNFRYTNKPSETTRIKKHLDSFQRNLTSFLPHFFLPSSYNELAHYERFIKEKYLGDFPLADAVVFVPKKTIKVIKTRLFVGGECRIDKAGNIDPQSLIDPRAEELRDRERCNDNECGEENNEPHFNEPDSEEGDNDLGRIVENEGPSGLNRACSSGGENGFGGIVENGKIRVEIISLLGCCCKMTLKKLNDEISNIETDNVIFKNGSPISDKDLENDGDNKLNVIFLCEETLKKFENSIDKNKKQALYKRKIIKRFNINVMNDFFANNVEKLTLAHELGHILFGHLNNTVKLQINRESQANFMASLMLNDKIDSIYMQYKTNFQPREYQRTLLLHNDFNSSNFTKALFKVLELE